MKRYIVQLRCVAYADVEAESPEQAMREASFLPAEYLSGVSAFVPETAVALDDVSGIAVHASHVRQKYGAPGRPKLSVADIPKRFRECYRIYKERGLSISWLAKEANLSRPTVYKYIKMIEKSTEDIEEC